MTNKLAVSVIYNTPTITLSPNDTTFVSPEGKIQQEVRIGRHIDSTQVNISEVGVLEECENIIRSLEMYGYDISLFSTDGNVKALLNFLDQVKPDIIFNLVEGILDDATKEMSIAALFELMNIPYTGSGPITLGTALSKVRVKEILLYNHLPTPKFQLFKHSTNVQLNKELSFPLIVKPAREDASLGIDNASVVHSLNELEERIHYLIERFAQPALVEEFINGREINAAVIGNKSNAVVLPLSEIVMDTLPEGYPRIVTYNAKWMINTVEYQNTVRSCPANLSKEVEAKIKALALEAYTLLEIRDYARVDVRLNEQDEPFILEVNPNPDISADAGFAASAKAAGYEYEQFVDKILEVACQRVGLEK